MAEAYAYDPDYVVAPGITLQEWFKWSHIPKSTATRLYGIPAEVLERILVGEEPITDDLAERLAALTHVPVRFWLALEHNYRVGLRAGKSRL